jgi:signal transduction histidine kinase
VVPDETPNTRKFTRNSIAFATVSSDQAVYDCLRDGRRRSSNAGTAGSRSRARCLLRYGVHCSRLFRDSQRSERLSKECELVLFRVLQESLTNVHRHSGASTASVTLTMDHGRLELQVSDNGNGIEQTRLAQVDEPGRQLGVGITGMRERVRKLGGRLDLQSSKAGTKLSVSVPTLSVIAPQIGAPAGVRG